VNTFRTILRGVGQTLITFGLVILLFCAYELWATNLYTSKQQSALGSQLHRAWDEGKDPLAPTATRKGVEIGAGIAVIRIPRLGRDYAKVVVEGVRHSDLKKGPGHYPGTALFGQLGNTVISGHRTTYGAPFNRLDEVQTGDVIVIETRTAWYSYAVTETSIVAPTAIEVTYPVPGQLDAKPTKKLLTLTTCNPKYSARTRLIVVAELTETRPKSEGPPPTITVET
jgi:sortase A